MNCLAVSCCFLLLLLLLFIYFIYTNIIFNYLIRIIYILHFTL